jgi:hypothetical protein
MDKFVLGSRLVEGDEFKDELIPTPDSITAFQYAMTTLKAIEQMRNHEPMSKALGVIRNLLKDVIDGGSGQEANNDSLKLLRDFFTNLAKLFYTDLVRQRLESNTARLPEPKVTTLSPLSLDGFLIDALNRCKAVQERATLLYHLEFASDNPIKLAKLISGICAEFESHLVRLRDRYEHDPVNILFEIRFVDYVTRELGAHLRYVEGAKTEKLPWSLPRPLERLAGRFLPTTTLMLRPQWHYNFSMTAGDLGDHYRKILEIILEQDTINKLFTDFPGDFHIISFPSIERKTSLLHCDLGHEIGHLVAKSFLEAEDRSYLIDLQKKVAKYVEEDLRARSLPPLWEEAAKTELISRELKRAVSVRERGLEEIISDIFGIHIFGPAALFALFEIALTDEFDLLPTQTSSFYPPWRTRLRFSIEALNALGFLPIPQSSYKFLDAEKVQLGVTNVIEDIRNIVASDSDKKALESDAIVKIAYESINDTIPHINGFLTEEHGDKFIAPNKLYGQVYPLVHRLSLGILPNAIEETLDNSQVAELESILNASWFYRVSLLSKPVSDNKLNTDFYDGYDFLNRLTLKAIELAFTQNLYNEWVNQGEGV